MTPLLSLLPVLSLLLLLYAHPASPILGGWFAPSAGEQSHPLGTVSSLQGGGGIPGEHLEHDICFFHPDYPPSHSVSYAVGSGNGRPRPGSGAASRTPCGCGMVFAKLHQCSEYVVVVCIDVVHVLMNTQWLSVCLDVRHAQSV